MRAIDWERINPDGAGFDFRTAKARLVSVSQEEGLLLEFLQPQPQGAPVRILVAMTLGQLMILKTQVTKEFNF